MPDPLLGKGAVEGNQVGKVSTLVVPVNQQEREEYLTVNAESHRWR